MRGKENVYAISKIVLISIVFMFLFIYSAIALAVNPIQTVYISGYQGFDVQFAGVYVSQAKHQDRQIGIPLIGSVWSRTHNLDSWLLKDAFGTNNNMVKFTYTPGGSDLPVRVCDDDRYWFLPSLKNILPNNLRIDIDGEGDPGGVADLKATLEAPVIDTEITSIAPKFYGQKQSQNVPYNVFTWEAIDNEGKKHRFRIDEYLLKGHLSIGIYPTNTDEKRSMYVGVYLWTKFIPRTTAYFRDVEGAKLEQVVFGIGKIKITNVKKKVMDDSTVGWANDSATSLHRDLDMTIYGRMGLHPETSLIWTPPDWESAIRYGNYYLDPLIFRTDYYVAFGDFDVGCWDTSRDVISDFFTGFESFGVVFDVEYILHALVVGQWSVMATYDVDWEGLTPYYAGVKGLFDYIADAVKNVADFLKSPSGFLLALLFVIIFIIILVVVIGAVCGISRAGQVRVVTVPISKQYEKMLNEIRKMRDRYLKPYKFGRFIVWFYYNVASPIMVAFIIIFGRVGAWIVRTFVTKPIYWLAETTLHAHIKGGKKV